MLPRLIERGSAGIRDPHPRHLDRPAAGAHVLDLRRREAVGY
jgi:hypothetical protein